VPDARRRGRGTRALRNDVAADVEETTPDVCIPVNRYKRILRINTNHINPDYILRLDGCQSVQ